MDEETRERFERVEREMDSIRGIVASVAQQQAHNTVAISQLTRNVEQLRQSLAEQNRLIQEGRGDMAEHASDPGAHSNPD